MDNPLLAVLVYDQPEPFGALCRTLGDLSLETYGARNWDAARALIREYEPLVVFVELAAWKKGRDAVLNTQAPAAQFFNVIVVGPLPDIEQYVATLEQGAFNFLAPPFSHESLTLAVHSAAMDATRRREIAVRASLVAQDVA